MITPMRGTFPAGYALAASGATRKPRARVMRSPMVRRVMGASSMHECVGGILRAMG